MCKTRQFCQIGDGSQDLYTLASKDDVQDKTVKMLRKTTLVEVESVRPEYAIVRRVPRSVGIGLAPLRFEVSTPLRFLVAPRRRGAALSGR